MTSENFTIPAIELPFAPSEFSKNINPHTAEVEQIVTQALYDIGDMSVHETASGIRLVEFAGRIYPEATQEGLQLVAWWFAVLIMQDEWQQERDPDGHLHSPPALAHTYQEAVRCLQGDPAGPDAPTFTHLLRPLGRLLDAAGEPHTSRFRTSLTRYFEAQMWELSFLRRELVPPLEVYPELRRQCSGILANFSLHPQILGLSIQDGVLDHIAVQELRKMLVNCIAWTNDLLSLRKELKEGSLINIVLLLRQRHQYTLQQAVNATTDMIHREAQAYLDLKGRLPEICIGSAQEQQELAALLTLEERTCADTFAWHQCPRYTTPT